MTAVMNISVYVLTHKNFTPPKDKIYVPLHVGHEGAASDLGYLADDTGDNISELNKYFSELTGLYWIWKNHGKGDLCACDDIVGTCHYRRYLLNDAGMLFDKNDISSLLSTFDIITTKELTLPFPYHYGFSKNHDIDHLDAAGNALNRLYPEYHDTYEKLVNDTHSYFGNMMICKKSLFDRYCSWLFSILFETEKNIRIPDDTDAYHKRVFGFISEFLLYVYVRHNGLKALECMVGMIGEKKETGECREQMSRFFGRRDYKGAKAYFLDYYKNRPDILMEASDITGELHICMQIISCCEFEASEGDSGETVLDRLNDYGSLIRYFELLNEKVRAGIAMSKPLSQLVRELDEYPAREVSIAYKMFDQ